jgi:hypothetical protein
VAIFAFLTPRRPSHVSVSPSRGIFSTLTSAVRSVVSPAGLFADQAPAEPVTAPDPSDTYGPDDMPPAEVIAAAAAEFERAADQARRADRGKRAARKVLDRLPSGTYSGWRIFRTPSSRVTPDLAAIAATYKALGLGPVPMKPCAPSLKVERVETVEAAELAGAVSA